MIKKPIDLLLTPSAGIAGVLIAQSAATLSLPTSLIINESTFIPVRTKHRLGNPGTIPLEMIEVQSGSYLGEDDIERFDDHYGRATVATIHNPKQKK